MVKPRFDRAELIRRLNTTPIEDYMFHVDLENGKFVTVSGKRLVEVFVKLEHFEASKVMEQWHWAEWYRYSKMHFLQHYAESLAKNGSIMTGILNFDIELKSKELVNESTT